MIPDTDVTLNLSYVVIIKTFPADIDVGYGMLYTMKDKDAAMKSYNNWKREIKIENIMQPDIRWRVSVVRVVKSSYLYATYILDQFSTHEELNQDELMHMDMAPAGLN